ncbi:MAG: thioredoxin-related protein, partial [Candidatus Paceibacteria bacterium]
MCFPSNLLAEITLVPIQAEETWSCAPLPSVCAILPGRNPTANYTELSRVRNPLQIITKPLVLLGLALFASPAIASEGWIADFDQAVKIAKEQKKDLLVDFTGSDWCGYCIKLDKEVFAHEVFTASVTADYVLVALDFPKSTEAKAKVPDAGRNQEIARKYGISGYPSVLLMTPDGVVFGRTGYRKGGADAYVEHLTELRSTGRRDLEVTLKVLATFNAAEGAAKTEALGELLKAFEGLAEDSPFAKTLFAAAQSAITLDPKNEHGLKLRAIRTLSMAGAHNAELLT